MEKKPTPSASSSRSNASAQSTNSKGQVSESRKSNLDSSGAKPSWPKHNRRRGETSAVEPAVGRQNNNNKNSGFKTGPKLNSNNQQQHNFNRSQRGSGAIGGARQRNESASSSTTSSSGLDHADASFTAELNSVYLPGSKKHNLNHLLNFNYAPRSANNHSSSNGNHGRTGMGRRQYVKYNKEQFLQANCQFVVRADMDWRPYTNSPDQLVEWPFIEQVHVQSSEEPQCPICLYHPVAGKMTRCGHVYCWPCVLHYLALSDKTWRKCPICYESIHAADLKSAISKSYVNYNVGDYVSLQLMCRPKDSLRVFKVSNSMATKDHFPHLSADEDELMHSKLILADPNEILSIIERERNELKCQLSADGADCPESMFIQQALDLLQERQLQCEQLATKFDAKYFFHPKPPKGDDSIENLVNSLSISAPEFVPQKIVGSNEVPEIESPENANFLIDEDSQLMLQDIDIIPAVADAQNYYFYQAADGQHLYMHSVNVRMLQVQWGSLQLAPHLIRGKILQKESCSMTDVLRKRLKYLQHLPVASQFEVVEIGLNESVVSNSVFAMFKDELSSRQKMRQRRAKEELKREKHIDEVNDRQIGKVRERSANIDVMSTQHFPMYNDWEAYPTAYDAISQNDANHPPLVESSSKTTDCTAIKKRERPTSSFARMLTTNEPTELWPTLAPSKTAAAFPELPTGNKVIASTSPPSRRYLQLNSECESIDDIPADADNDDEAAARPPEYRPDYGTAIANALNQQAILNAVSNRKNNGAGSGQKQKKKKNTVLFSTNVRSYNGN